MSYGVDVPDLFGRSATYVDRILKGAKPGELPVQAPTKFQLVINLRTAKAVGLEVPVHLPVGLSPGLTVELVGLPPAS